LERVFWKFKREWEIIYLDKVDSTQKFFIKNLSKFNLPSLVWSEYQTDGIGSRGNKWIGKRGNLFFTFGDFISNYKDVPLHSFSIYFGFLFKKVLNELGSKALMKWPNDIYLNGKKIGGVLTQVKGDVLICGIGLNRFEVSGFGKLDIDVKNDKILLAFLKRLDSGVLFKDVMDEFKEEFEKYKGVFGIEGELSWDGSIVKNQKKVYSWR